MSLKRRLGLIVGLILGLIFFPVHFTMACTLFSTHRTTVPVAGKIRDTLPNHDQEVRVVTASVVDGEKHSYLGLFATRGPESIVYSPLKAGVNERGLFIGFSTPSGVPTDLRRRVPFFKDLTHHLLTRAASVGEALELLNALSEEGRALGFRIMLISDGAESALFENGYGHASITQSSFHGTLSATNHFQSRNLRNQNLLPIEDSYDRLQRAQSFVSQLLQISPNTLSQDVNNLWIEAPGPGQTFTRSHFLVFYPVNATPVVEIKKENHGSTTTERFLLSEIFEAKLSLCLNTLTTSPTQPNL